MVQKLEVGRNLGQLGRCRWKPPYPRILPPGQGQLPNVSRGQHATSTPSVKNIQLITISDFTFSASPSPCAHLIQNHSFIDSNTFFGVRSIISWKEPMSFSVNSSVGQEGKFSSHNLAKMNSTCTSVFFHLEFENSNSKILRNSSSTSFCFMLSEISQPYWSSQMSPYTLTVYFQVIPL